MDPRAICFVTENMHTSLRCFVLLWLYSQVRQYSCHVHADCCTGTVTIVGFLGWRHQTETFSVLLALCAGNSPVTGEFPSQRPVTGSFDVFIDWVNDYKAGDLGRHRVPYYVIVMFLKTVTWPCTLWGWASLFWCWWFRVVSECILSYTPHKKFSNTWWWDCGSRNSSKIWNVGCTKSKWCTKLTFTPFDTLMWEYVLSY